MHILAAGRVLLGLLREATSSSSATARVQALKALSGYFSPRQAAPADDEERPPGPLEYATGRQVTSIRDVVVLAEGLGINLWSGSHDDGPARRGRRDQRDGRLAVSTCAQVARVERAEAVGPRVVGAVLRGRVGRVAVDGGRGGAGAMVLDHAGVRPNPARDKTIKLPREEPEEINPPSAEDVETVYRLIPAQHRLALLWLDWSGARVSSVDLTLQGDYDERRRRVRLRAATTKTRKPLWVELHPALADALEVTLPHRKFRELEARLFAENGANALRTAIAKACKAAGIPVFSPHDLRHRRISLLHLRGVPWARIGEFVGQRDLTVAANTYTHVLADETEVNYVKLLA